MTLQARDLTRSGWPVVYVDSENGKEFLPSGSATAGGITPEEADAHFENDVRFPRDLRLDELRAEFDAIREALPGAHSSSLIRCGRSCVEVRPEPREERRSRAHIRTDHGGGQVRGAGRPIDGRSY